MSSLSNDGVARSPADVRPTLAARRAVAPCAKASCELPGTLSAALRWPPRRRARRLAAGGRSRWPGGRGAGRHLRRPGRGGLARAEGLVERRRRPGRALDTRALPGARHRLPRRQRRRPPGRAPARPTFPSISAYDQAEILRRVARASATSAPLQAIVGASYGGMVALAFAERYPSWCSTSSSISAADRSHPMATAWRSVQRAIVRYAAADTATVPEGLRLARALAMATYRSPEEFAARFGGAADADRRTLPVSGRGLSARARRCVRAPRMFPKRSCACRSRSICIGSMRRASACRRRWSRSVEDQLVPLADMRALQARLGGAGAAGRAFVAVRPRCVPEGRRSTAAGLCTRAGRTGRCAMSQRTLGRPLARCARRSSPTRSTARSCRRSI